MYKLHSLQHPDWYRTGTSYCYCYIIEIIHHDSVIFSKTYPSFLTIKEGVFLPLRLSCKESSTFLTKPLFPQEREDVTALRCSEPLRSKVGGPSKVFAILCGMGPPDYRLIPISYMLFSEFHYLSVNNFFPKFVQSSFIPVLYNLLFFCIREFDRTLLIYVEMQIR